MTRTVPLRLMILHLGQRRLTDADTFIAIYSSCKLAVATCLVFAARAALSLKKLSKFLDHCL